VVAEAATTEYREQILMSYTVECVLKIKSEDTQREMYFSAYAATPLTVATASRIVLPVTPTVLREWEMQVHEWSEPSSKDAG
jgi:hypothetical protein